MAYPASIEAGEEREGGHSRGREEQGILYQLAHDLARAVDSATIADLLFTRTHALLGAEYGILMLANADGSVLQGVAAREVPSERFRQERIRVNDESSSVSLAFRTQQPIIIPEVATDSRVDERLRHAYPLIKSAWAVPLMSGERAVGALSVGFAVSRTATLAEIRLLQLLGDEAALALERARLTEEIQASETRFRLLAEHSSDLIARQTLEGQYLYVSPASRLVLGYAPEDLVGSSLYQWVHPNDQEALRGVYARLRETRDACTFTYRHRRHDGGYIWVEATIRAIWETTPGTVVEIQTTSRNITARKQAEATLHTAQVELERQVHEQTAALRTVNTALQDEIREHQRTAAELREAEEQYRELVENLNDVIYAQDEYGRFTYVSPVVELLSGYQPSELLGRPYDDFIHPADLPALRASAQRTLAGQLEPSEFRVRLKSGEWRWVRSSSRPIVRADRVCGLRGMVTDITERKQAEARATALLEIAKDVSGTLDRAELLTRVQRRMATVLSCEIVATFFWDPGRSVFRLISQYGLSPSTLLQAEDLAFPPEEPFGGRLSRGGAVVINEIQTQPWLPVELLTQFGITALVAVPLQVRQRELGTLVACTTGKEGHFGPEQVELCHGIARQVAVALEVADLYQKQQEETEVATMLEQIGRALLAPLNTVRLLEQLCRLTSEALGGSWSCTLLWQPEEAVYRVVASWGYPALQRERLEVFTVPEEALARLRAAFAVDDVLALNRARRGELLSPMVCQQLGLEQALCVRLQRGEEVCGFHACGYEADPIFSDRQVRLARGIAQLASLALANAQLVDELTQANRIKEDFMGLMSHELRTPLNIIVGYTQLLLEETFGMLTPEQADTLERIARNSRELLELITATLDLSRLQNQQRLALTLQEVDAAMLLTELESESAQLPHHPTVRVHWDRSPQLPRLQTDVLKLKMVLKNLLTNALKFTEEGTVTVSARPHQVGVEFCVTDTGRGIAREALPLIFEPFRQAESSLTSQHSGVGLGLYIVRQVVMLLGGQIRVESEVGQGSAFCVWFPASQREGP